MTNDELLHKWINGTITEEEEKRFQQRPEFDSLQEIYRLTDHLKVPELDETKMLSNIFEVKKTNVPTVVPAPKEKTRTAAKTSQIVPFSTYIKYGLAASILIAVTYFFILHPSDQRVAPQWVDSTATQEKVEGVLPDESTYVLNLESTLSYDVKAWSKERVLNLQGEAFFEVKKGTTFQVKTPNGIVQILGTKFNVWSRDNILEVACTSGKVAVLSVSGTLKKELNEAEAVRVLADGAVEELTVITKNKKNWQQGISRFERVPLSRVIQELERQFNIQINVNPAINQQEVISCHFQHKKLENALRTSLSPLKIQYQINEKERTVQLF